MSYRSNFVAIVFALALLALVFIVPIIGVFFVVRRIKSKIAASLFILAVVVSPLAYLYFSGYVGSSAIRLEKEHGISIPHSISNIQCDPIFAISIFIDASGSASFEISRRDLPTFISQFKGLRTQGGADYTNDWTSNHANPMKFGPTIFSFTGLSHDGNVMHIEVHDIDASTVGVWVGTISN